MYKIKIDGKEYPILFKIYTSGIYEKLTGSTLTNNPDEFHVLFGLDKEEDGQKTVINQNPLKFVAFIQACLMTADVELTELEALKIASRVDGDADTYANIFAMASPRVKNESAPTADGALPSR